MTQEFLIVAVLLAVLCIAAGTVLGRIVLLAILAVGLILLLVIL